MAHPTPRLNFDGALMAPVQPLAWAAFERAALAPGNPSSVHQAGQEARRLVEGAARHTAAWLRLPEASSVLWLGSSFEARLLLLAGLHRAPQTPPTDVLQQRQEDEDAAKGQTLWLGAHGGGAEATVAAAQALGTTVQRVSYAAFLDGTIAAHDASGRPWARLVVEAADGASGALAPLTASGHLAAWARRLPWALCLGAAAPLWPELHLGLPKPDAVVVDAGPVGGPQGATALALALGASVRPVSLGGGQQNGLRPGTVAKEMASGLAAALHELPDADSYGALQPLRDSLETFARTALGATVCGPGCNAHGPRLPHVTLLHLPCSLPALTALQGRLAQARLAVRLRRGLCGRHGLHVGLHPQHTSADVARLQAALLGLCKADTTCARGWHEA